MQLGSPIDAVAASVYHAMHVAFKEVTYQTRDFESEYKARQKGKPRDPDVPPRYVERVRRPFLSECQVMAMFPQTWGSTALGFGGIGGAAMTPAYTVVVHGPRFERAVYFNGSFAYMVLENAMTEEQKGMWQEDVARQGMRSRVDAKQAYGATW